MAQAALSAALGRAVGASLSLDASARPSFIAAHLLAVSDGAEPPSAPPYEASANMDALRLELKVLERTLTAALNSVREHTGGELLRQLARALSAAADPPAADAASRMATPEPAAVSEAAAAAPEAAAAAAAGAAALPMATPPESAPAAAAHSGAAAADTALAYGNMGWGEFELGKLNKRLVESLDHIESLDLSQNNQLRGGDGGSLSDVLERLPNLLHADFSGCTFLRGLPDTMGAMTPRLETLLLNGCSRLLTLPKTLGTMLKLSFVDCRNCESLGALPTNIGECAALERFYVSQSPAEGGVTVIPESLARVGALVHLELNCLHLGKVPEALGEGLPALRSLIVNTALLPASVATLRSLEYLEVGQGLTDLPEGLLSGLVALRTLDLGSCIFLKTLPDDVGALAATLEVLYIGSMDMTVLPDALCMLTKLTHLELRGCASLQTLPDALGDLSALQTLVAKKSGLVSLPASIGRLTSLVALKLSECVALAALPDEVCELTTALVALELQDCTSITKLPAGYGQLQALRHLDFSGCEDLSDVMYDDPIVDELEARGCGMLGPGFEIEPPGYDATKTELLTIENIRLARLAILRGDVSTD